MIPGFYAIDLYRGDTYEVTFLMEIDPAATITAQIRDGNDDIQGQFAIERVTGGVTLSLTAAETSEIIDGLWDLQINDPATGSVNTYLRGRVYVTKDVTRVL